MRGGVITEADTCREFVTPRLVEGDALYWPIFNLDLKDPNGKAGLEHADPKDLIASTHGHEAEVMRFLGEIEALVSEVQA
jgi:type I restriction enzyme M protein